MEENNWIKNIKVGDEIFIHEFRVRSSYAEDKAEMVVKLGRKYITTDRGRKIRIEDCHEQSNYNGCFISKAYRNKNEYMDEVELNQKHQEIINKVKYIKKREYIEHIYSILKGESVISPQKGKENERI